MGKGYTATEAAKELELTRQGLEERLKLHGIKPKKGRTYTLAEIVGAMTSRNNDKEAIVKARREKLEAEARLMQLDCMEREKELAKVDVCLDMIRSSFVPVRQRLMALPSEAASRCNPTDPDLARDALMQWVDASLSKIREDLPKVEPEADEVES